MKKSGSFLLLILVIASVSWGQIKPTGKPVEPEAEAPAVLEPEVFTDLIRCETSSKAPVFQYTEKYETVTFEGVEDTYQEGKAEVISRPENIIVLSRSQYGTTRIQRDSSEKGLLLYPKCLLYATKDISVYDCPSSFNQGIILQMVPGKKMAQLKVKFGPYLQVTSVDCENLPKK